MPNISVRAAAEVGFLRMSLMAWNSLVGSDPATQKSVEERFMNQHVNRRTVVAVAAGVDPNRSRPERFFVGKREAKSVVGRDAFIVPRREEFRRVCKFAHPRDYRSYRFLDLTAGRIEA
ncbi:hypothetical protein [Mesorhizobium sp.]|uniref:hypothetical protein n=1 Tax=Mesorhizobium sp. TaxID=1871066 RepID=UPI000FE63A67|nr:hypothetical protein [Mesorhizobium sp.]RWO86019.1 MAG: hypothetical protein EOQ95_23070 [Mesorhizobium sp.]